MDATEARRITRAQEARRQLLERALKELDLKFREIVRFHGRNKTGAIKGVRALLRERYAKELAAIPHLAGENQHNPDFSIAREIVRRLTTK